MPLPSRRRTVRTIGQAVLVLALPLAVLAATHAPNEYAATLGLDAVDCDGPLGTYLLAVPALLIYAIGLAVSAAGRRPVAALLCLTLCGAIAVNVARARQEEKRQEPACRIAAPAAHLDKTHQIG